MHSKIEHKVHRFPIHPFEVMYIHTQPDPLQKLYTGLVFVITNESTLSQVSILVRTVTSPRAPHGWADLH